MRLVLVTAGLDGQVGGIQRVTRAVQDALLEEGRQDIIWSSNDVNSGTHENIQICSFNSHYRVMCLKALAYWNPKIKSIYCFHLALSPVAALLAFKFRCPFHVFLHGTESWGKLSWQVKYSLKRASSFGSNSKYTYHRFSKTHPDLAKADFRLVPLGLNKEFIGSTQNPTGYSPKFKKYFLTVTRFEEEYKGLETLLVSFQKVYSRFPDVGLVIVGEGVRRPSVKKYAESLEVSAAVQFTGRISDAELTSLYRDCLCFILLSQGEGFGIVFTEAMYFGKPCISTDADASQELVKSQQTGFAVPPGNVEATAEAMTRLVDEPGLASRLGANARSMVLANYMPEHFSKRLKEFMNS